MQPRHAASIDDPLNRGEILDQVHTKASDAQPEEEAGMGSGPRSEAAAACSGAAPMGESSEKSMIQMGCNRL
jgi:hypothetical protein